MFIEQKEYRWVDNSVKIDDFYDDLPPVIKNLVDDCEKADAEEDWAYTNYCDSVENASKLYVPSGRITKDQFERLCMRYYG